MNDYPSGTSLILVAILPSPQDFEIARVLGWYRIPIRRAPKVVDVDYLAFYQTTAFGEGHRWQICYLAPMTGHALTTRDELIQGEVNHPHAKEEYYKLQLGPIIELPEPIPAGRWRRITFFHTTGDYLSRAKTINDLVVQSDEREVLWSSLRERALQKNRYQGEELPELPVDPAILDLFEIIYANKRQKKMEE